VIVRILGEGQYELGGDPLEELQELDSKLFHKIEAGDEVGFHEVLNRAFEKVRGNGTPVDPSTIVPSDLTLPQPDATLEEVRALLASEDTGEA
jgi:hypothetical protein